MSSPYLCVFGDEHVTRYMEADVDAGEHANAQRRSGDHYGTNFLNFIMDFSFVFFFYFGGFGFVITEYCGFIFYLCDI